MQASDIELREEPLTALADHGTISIAFCVERIVDLTTLNRSPAARFADRHCPAPYIKDYDAITGNRPADWAERFASLCHTSISAYRGGERIGSAVVVVDSPTARLIDGDADVAVLWDLRVHPTSRGMGVGGALFKAAENWARARGCRQMKVETQDVNVPACRLYAKEGCRLESVEHGAYRELPSEVRLIWAKSLCFGF